MTDHDIKAATGIPHSTFHRWANPQEGGLPRWEKVAAFCIGLEIPTEAAAAALGITDPTRTPQVRTPQAEPIPDPDLQRLGRILRDPNVPEARKQAIREMVRMLARGSRAEADT